MLLFKYDAYWGGILIIVRIKLQEMQFYKNGLVKHRVSKNEWYPVVTFEHKKISTYVVSYISNYFVTKFGQPKNVRKISAAPRLTPYFDDFQNQPSVAMSSPPPINYI